MIWRLIWTSRAEKDLVALHPVAARRIHRTLDRFSQTGHADIRRLVNIKPPTWRIRIGRHRIILALRKHPNEARILRIKPRHSAY